MSKPTEPTPHQPVGLRPDGRVHFVGIGGSGMSALAFVLLERGMEVSGSDLRGGRTCTALAAMGATVRINHEAAHVEGADLVVVSTAVPATNPEVERARDLGIPLLHRGQLLAEVAAARRTVFVAGTHGKTTTTAMAVVALQEAGLDPAFVIGGALHDAGTSAHEGTGDLFVGETDESDRSFLYLRADCAVVTNVELDHHDTYADDADVEGAFSRWVGQRTEGGTLIACADDAGAARVAASAGGDVRMYGTDASADLRIADIRGGPDGSTFSLVEGDTPLGMFSLAVPGAHNVRNAAAAVAVARWAGADLEAVRDGLRRFAGAQRRFQRLGSAGGVTVVDDYAHHPTEVEAVLSAARQIHDGRLVAVFQPHRYSRTAALAEGLGRALAAADLVVVADVYGAGELPVPGVGAALVGDAARAEGAAVQLIGPAGSAADLLAGLVDDGDLVLTLGAGDITEVGPALLERLGARRA